MKYPYDVVGLAESPHGTGGFAMVNWIILHLHEVQIVSRLEHCVHWHLVNGG